MPIFMVIFFLLEILYTELWVGLSDERKASSSFINHSEIAEALWPFSILDFFLQSPEQVFNTCVTKVNRNFTSCR